jgi:hypothetical protein
VWALESAFKAPAIILPSRDVLSFYAYSSNVYLGYQALAFYRRENLKSWRKLVILFTLAFQYLLRDYWICDEIY